MSSVLPAPLVLDGDLPGILFFLAAATALFFFMRRLSERGGSAPPPPPDFTAAPDFSAEEVEHDFLRQEDARRPPPMVGREYAERYSLSGIAPEGVDDTMPLLRNFYFRRTDMEAGPANRQEFLDVLVLELEDPESGHRWQYETAVGSPQGLASALGAMANPGLAFDNLVVVPEFDVRNILRATLGHIAEGHRDGPSGELEGPGEEPRQQ